MDHSQYIAEKLESARDERGMTVAELAVAATWAGQAFGRMSNGGPSTSIDSMKNVLRGLPLREQAAYVG